MDNKGGLGGYSPDQMNKLAKLLAETKQLMQQQEVLIQKVLAGETKIGEVRVSYLEEYNQGYSRLLNQVSDQCKSLNSDFFALHKQVTDIHGKLDESQKRKDKPAAASKTANGTDTVSSQSTNNSHKQATSSEFTALTTEVTSLRNIIAAIKKDGIQLKPPSNQSANAQNNKVNYERYDAASPISMDYATHTNAYDIVSNVRSAVQAGLYGYEGAITDIFNQNELAATQDAGVAQPGSSGTPPEKPENTGRPTAPSAI